MPAAPFVGSVAEAVEAGDTVGDGIMVCPKCRRKQFYVCGDPACTDKNFRRDLKPQRKLAHDALACPYCGFTAHMDFWEERAMEDAFRKPYKSLPVIPLEM